MAKYKKPYTRGGKRRLAIRCRRLTISWNTSSENTIRKLTTGPTLVQKGRGKQFLTNLIVLRRGRRWKAIGMAASKAMVRVDVAWWSKGLTGKDGWQSVKLPSLWKLAQLWQLRWVVGVCVLTGILDLVVSKSLCVRRVNECINTVLNKQWC